MKLQINYDMLDKIKEAKTGMRLKQIPKFIAFNMAIYTPFTLLTNLALDTPEENIPKLILGAGIYAGFNFAREHATSPKTKDKAEDELRHLRGYLELLNISTTQDQLLESEKYKTEYKLLEKNEKGLRKLQTNKYILIPTSNQEEVSILQEHVVGTNTYTLSLGEPKKVYKLSLASNSA